MPQVVVGVADCQTSREPDTVLVTYALGSCIGLALHDRGRSIGGLLHFMLPHGSLDPEKARLNPWMFADTGVPLLIEKMVQLGAERRKLSARAVGGAQVLDPEGVFNIGKRNFLELKKLLWKAGLMLEGERVGGTVSRTVKLEVGSGRLTVNEAGTGEIELARSPGEGASENRGAAALGTVRAPAPSAAPAANAQAGTPVRRTPPLAFARLARPAGGEATVGAGARTTEASQTPASQPAAGKGRGVWRFGS